MGSIVDNYEAAKEAVFKHTGYVEDWRSLSLEDSREMFWAVDDFERRWCRYSPVKEDLEYYVKTGDYSGPGADHLFEDEIYTNRHLPKWVYRGPEFTLVCCDTQSDGNQFLRIFRNDMEVGR